MVDPGLRQPIVHSCHQWRDKAHNQVKWCFTTSCSGAPEPRGSAAIHKPPAAAIIRRLRKTHSRRTDASGRAAPCAWRNDPRPAIMMVQHAGDASTPATAAPSKRRLRRRRPEHVRREELLPLPGHPKPGRGLTAGVGWPGRMARVGVRPGYSYPGHPKQVLSRRGSRCHVHKVRRHRPARRERRLDELLPMGDLRRVPSGLGRLSGQAS